MQAGGKASGGIKGGLPNGRLECPINSKVHYNSSAGQVALPPDLSGSSLVH